MAFPNVMVPGVRSGRDPVLPTVLAFLGLGVIVLGLVGAASIVALRRVAIGQSVGDAQHLALLSARIVEPRIQDGLVTAADPVAQVRVAAIVGDAVLHDPVVAVRIWKQDGTILYSDSAQQIGQRYATGARLMQIVSPGQVLTRLVDSSAPEDGYLARQGQLLESFVRIETPDHTPLLFETVERFSSVVESKRQLMQAFLPVGAVALVAFILLLTPVVWLLARRVARGSRERERLLRRTIEISGRERRRIARDIHDGPVQELAGIALRLSGEVELSPASDRADSLRAVADSVRDSVRTLRSAIVGIYPPNLESEGLAIALFDLTARLPREGLDVKLKVADPAGYGAEIDELLYRACQEALRNIAAHAEARSVSIDVRRKGLRAILEVRDDGRGIADDDAQHAKDDGHFGLEILRDVIRDGGGELSLRPGIKGGTVLRAEVPVA